MPHIADYQIVFGGLLIGDGTDYDVDVEEGLESWDVRDSDVPFPNQWGSLPGVDEVNARKIRLEVQMLGVDPAIPLAFESAFLPTGGTDLEPLIAKFPGRDDITFDVRCRSRSRRRDVPDSLGLVKIEVLLVAPDPRAYSYVEEAESLEAYSAGSEALNLTAGSGADLAFNLTAGSGADLGFNFTGVAAVGDFVCVNDGNVDTYPSFLFTPAGSGALTEYRVSNLTTEETLTLTAAVPPGQTLTADMAMVATPKQGLPISLAGESRYGSWSQPRTPLRLAPESNTLRFEVLSGTAAGATCLVMWRSASL
jgi:hypothetical protein